MNEPFDEFAMKLASMQTRRGALRHIGTGLAGVLLGTLGINRAWATTTSNSAAATWCAAHFPPGPARGNCVNNAALGTGVYYQCGPGAPAGAGPLCGGICCAS